MNEVNDELCFPCHSRVRTAIRQGNLPARMGELAQNPNPDPARKAQILYTTDQSLGDSSPKKDNPSHGSEPDKKRM